LLQQNRASVSTSPTRVINRRSSRIQISQDESTDLQQQNWAPVSTSPSRALSRRSSRIQISQEELTDLQQQNRAPASTSPSRALSRKSSRIQISQEELTDLQQQNRAPTSTSPARVYSGRSSRVSTPAATPMQIDNEDFDDYDSRDNCDDLKSLPKSHDSKESYITTNEFNYSMNLLNEKITSLYKLCRFISDQQQKNTQLLQKLVIADELTNDFWNVS
jgi:hypothetical protein